MYKYAIELFYSKEDQGYIATVPELAGCSAFGESEEMALKEVKIATDLWMKVAKKEGRKIPKPLGKELLKSFVSECEEQSKAAGQPVLVVKEQKGKYKAGNK